MRDRQDRCTFIAPQTAQQASQAILRTLEPILHGVHGSSTEVEEDELNSESIKELSQA